MEKLHELSQKTFCETFAQFNTKSDLNEYLETSLDYDNLQHELEDDSSDFYFAYVNEKLAGYLKINDYEAQTDINDSDSLEIERIYVLREYQNTGLGQYLMDKAVDIAKHLGKSYVWLGVWEHNNKASRFYNKNAFYVIGQHTFMLGSDKQVDILMRKDLE